MPRSDSSLPAAGDQIRQELESRGAPSLACAVSMGGEVVYADAFGWADRERELPATPDTAYSVASITKPITATALMLLVERGLLDLDRPINDYLDGATVRAWAGSAETATVRRVAGHTAGLPLHYQFFYADEPDRPPPREESIRRYGKLVRAPGDRYVYSNLGYGILDHVISRVGGRPWATLLQEEVFGPLGMTNSAAGLANVAGASAIRYGSDGVPYPDYDFDHPGGSAAFASAKDLVRFGAFHLGRPDGDQREILSASSRLAMQAAGPGAAAAYGIGWILDREAGAVMHSGGMGGVATLLVLFPKRELAVAAVCNASSPLPWIAVLKLLEAVDAELGATMAARAAAMLQRSQLQPAKVGRELTGKWRGAVETYAGAVELDVTVGPRGGVSARIGGTREVPARPIQVEGVELACRFAGELPTPDARRRPHHLWLAVSLDGERLTGTLTALSEPKQEGGAPKHRAGGALSHWVALDRSR